MKAIDFAQVCWSYAAWADVTVEEARLLRYIDLLWHAARFSDLRPSQVRSLAGDADANIRLAIAGRADLSPALVAHLATDDDADVRCCVAFRVVLPASEVESFDLIHTDGYAVGHDWM